MTETTHLWRVIQQWIDLLPFAPSQSKLAESLGLSRSVISEWKLGKSRPSPDNLKALATQMRFNMGPDIYERLLEAVNRDMGYLPPENEGGEEHADGSPATKPPAPGPADQPGRHLRAARTLQSKGKRRAEASEGIGEESQDDDEMGPS